MRIAHFLHVIFIREGRRVTWEGLTKDETKVLKDYFNLVGRTIQTYAKQDFLDQV